MAAPTFHKLRMVPGVSGTSVTITTPEGASAGDALYIAIKVEGSAVTIEGPAGWTKIAQTRTEANGGWQAALFELPNWNGSTTTYTVTWGGASHGYNALIAAFSGADTSNPRNVTSSEGIKENASATNVPVQGYSTTVPETLPVTFVWNSNGQQTNPAAGWTEDGDQADGPEAAHKTEALATAQTLGTTTHTFPVASVSLTIGLALQPPQAVVAPRHMALLGVGK